MKNRSLVPIEVIENKIFLICGQKVMIDRDLAELYGVKTKGLNQAVKRNHERFPESFMFQLSEQEKDQLVTICDRFKALKHSSSLPYAFTEHGVLMLSSVLSSKRAVHVNIQIMKVFVRLREMLTSHNELKGKIEHMEKKYDGQFRIVFDAIKKLMEEPEKKSLKKIGFIK